MNMYFDSPRDYVDSIYESLLLAISHLAGT